VRETLATRSRRWHRRNRASRGRGILLIRRERVRARLHTLPARRPYLKCEQIPDSKKPVRVTGADQYRLDRDRDGLGCEIVPEGGRPPYGLTIRKPPRKEATAFRYRPQLATATLTKRRPFTLTYRINPDARWSDGKPITSTDFRARATTSA
jgi:hypothetical protein